MCSPHPEDKPGFSKRGEVPALATKGITVGQETGGQGFSGCLDSRLASSSFVSFQQRAPWWVPCHPLKLRPLRDESLFGFVVASNLGHRHLCAYRQRRKGKKVLGKGSQKQRAEQKTKMKKRQSSTAADESREQTRVRAGTLAGSSVQMLFLL